MLFSTRRRGIALSLALCATVGAVPVVGAAPFPAAGLGEAPGGSLVRPAQASEEERRQRREQRREERQQGREDGGGGGDDARRAEREQRQREREERERGDTERKLRHQIQEGLAKVATERLGDVVIAYEPVWAIGTGQVATLEQAQDHIEEQVEWFTDQFYDGLTPEEAAKEALA